MGSMTGAPKVRAMELIEEYENFRRGWFSGSVGFISPNGDMKSNVIIRSILYDSLTKKASLAAGGAITALSDPEDEYEESLLKAEAMKNALLSTITPVKTRSSQED
jgi:para-aminobenzoate synthetase component I